MPGAAPPGGEFAIGNDEQYRPVQAVGDQQVPVSGPEGTGLLACHASRPLGSPYRGPVVVVVHGALRDPDRYLASTRPGWPGRTPSSSPRSSWPTSIIRPAGGSRGGDRGP